MNRNFIILGLLAVAGGANAQSFFEGFEGVTSTGVLAIAPLPGWDVQNTSAPLNTTHGGWFNGNAAVFAANTGTKYAASNFASGTGLATNDTWLITPTRTLQNGDQISFFSRTVTSVAFPDRLHLRMSLNGASTNVADFSTILLTINPTLTLTGYPSVWTMFSATVSGLGGPTSGRFAFNYNVTNGGPNGTNADYIGVDDVRYSAVPEPATMTALALGAVAFIRRRRK